MLFCDIPAQMLHVQFLLLRKRRSLEFEPHLVEETPEDKDSSRNLGGLMFWLCGFVSQPCLL